MAGTNFFDFLESQGRRREEIPAAIPPEPITVTQLTQLIDRAIKSGVPATVHVKGEISNVNLHRTSGHLYFTLKDANACIDSVMFRSEAERLKFDPEDGMEMLVTGSVRVYAQRGRYQLYATNLQPLGKGALELAFQQLQAKLEKEGLFSPERKKLLPQFPRRIVIVTSRQTAALQDILKVFQNFPWLRLSLFHVPVQGDGSAELIADALRTLNRDASRFDLILLARGGGSLEDLWEFNEEIVARAIASSRIPIITGVGHEVDVSIADLVADYHAHTPTEAAQVAVAQWRGARETLRMSEARLLRSLRVLVSESKQRLLAAARHEFFRRPLDRVNQLRQLLDDHQRSFLLHATRQLRETHSRVDKIAARLTIVDPTHIVRLRRQRLKAISHQLAFVAKRDIERWKSFIEPKADYLRALSPQAVLHRGYSITTNKKGDVLRDAKSVKPGDKLITRFADGEVDSTVQDSKQLSLFE